MPQLLERWCFVASVMVAMLVFGCGGGGHESGTAKGPRPGGRAGAGACALLLQSEVDEIFGVPIGAGTNESLGDGAELCSWPANEDPALLLQVGPAVANLNTAVDLGEGYRIAEIPGMKGPAAMAVELARDPHAEETVALVAMNVSQKTVTLSPVGLGVKEGTDRFERLKALVERVAGRL